MYAGDFMIFLMTFRTLKYPATQFLWPQPPLTKYKEPYNSNSVFFFLQKKIYIYECIYIGTYISKGIKSFQVVNMNSQKELSIVLSARNLHDFLQNSHVPGPRSFPQIHIEMLIMSILSTDSSTDKHAMYLALSPANIKKIYQNCENISTRQEFF